MRTVAVDVKAGGYVAVPVTLHQGAGGCALHKAVAYIKHDKFHNCLPGLGKRVCTARQKIPGKIGNINRN